MKIVFFGTPSFVVPVLSALIKHFEVISVVTSPDKKSGRTQTLKPSPCKQFALEHKLYTITPQKISNKDLLTEHNKPNLLPADLFVVAAYGKLVPNEILSIPKYGAINIHPSLLPKYRGPSPVQSAILNGDKATGISFMKMDAKMDHGEILSQIRYEIKQSDTFETLVTKLFHESAILLPQIIETFAKGKLHTYHQDESKATYTKMIQKEDGYIDIHNLETGLHKKVLDRRIRAYYPWPTTWTKWQMKDGKWRIIKFLPDNKIQMEGKYPVDLKDFLNGYPELQDIFIKIFKSSQ